MGIQIGSRRRVVAVIRAKVTATKEARGEAATERADGPERANQ